MIKPTIGRVIHVYRNGPDMPPEPALITYVHSDRKINVAGFSYTGDTFSVRDCPLMQDDESIGTAVCAAWMPYQISKAASEPAPMAVDPVEAVIAPPAPQPDPVVNATISPAKIGNATITPASDPAA